MAANHLRSVQGNKIKHQANAPSPGMLRLETDLAYAIAITKLIPYPAVLWSCQRRLHTLNDAARQLLGFCEADFPKAADFWLERVHPQDREELLFAWNSLAKGQKEISLQYRFYPKDQPEDIWLREVSFSDPFGRPENTEIWSFFSKVPTLEPEAGEIRQVQELVRGLAHEIANSLQVISGELDLLRLAGAGSQQSSKAILHGGQQIRKLATEIEEYFSPPPIHLRAEDPAAVLSEVIKDSERVLAQRGIRMAVVVKEPLPKLPLDWPFRDALRRIIEFSQALLPEGGELNIEAGLKRIGESWYVELNLVNASPTRLSVEESDVFRPFLKVNDCRVGLSMVTAQQILRRRFGKIVFRKEHRNRGVFSILIKVPSEV